MTEEQHFCTVCHLPVEAHDQLCPCGCGERYMFGLCCKGCGCGSFEMAHEHGASWKGIQP